MTSRRKTDSTHLAERSSARWVRHVSRNTWLILLLSTVTFTVGLCVAIAVHDFEWFARSGAVVSALGIALISQAALLAETVRTEAVNPDSGLNSADPTHYKATNQEVPDWVQRDARTRFTVGIIGPSLSGIGTLVWAFGDLLNRLR
jgi:hypothetical protein